MTFETLGVIAPILKALEAEGYKNPTPIQEQSIPILLKGKDLLGCAQTGTGKTAAFAIPIIQHLYQNKKSDKGRRKVKALIVTPTRELALQIGESFTTYGKFTGIKNTVVFGGVKQLAQTQALLRGVDVLIATPGRLLDLIDQGYISLKDVEFSVLDEADHMLDMGFIHDIKKIIRKLPSKRQSLFFSATMPTEIVALSQKILGNPEKVTINPEQTTADKVKQAVYYVSKSNKTNLLKHLLQTEVFGSVLIFSRTKHGADRIVRLLGKAQIKAVAIHGNKSQAARQRALESFKNGEVSILVATDIAARGIDVEELSYVINYDLPNIPETYIHRIGRTGRANLSGIALSFCDGEERSYLKDIQKLIDQKIPIISDQPFEDDGTFVPSKKTSQQHRKPQHKSSKPSHSSNRNHGGSGRKTGSGGRKKYGNNSKPKARRSFSKKKD
ncbi:MAG: DEAD/DEAH box helicase [Bacteroidales bacterium]|nr:DEAD/DEAH box helicase [Bacteroidales bacterium]